MPGEVTISGAGMRVTALLGEEGAIVTAGYGGWTLVSRPRRQSITRWDGQAPLEMSLSILIDGFQEDRSIETDCSKLERMARSESAFKEPPQVRISGPVPHTDQTWVIDGLEWRSAERSRQGYRIRQAVIVQLMRYVAEDRVKVAGAAGIARSATASSQRTSYTVRQGETLTSIAAAVYGDASQWRNLADANDIRDPKNINAGDILRIP